MPQPPAQSLTYEYNAKFSGSNEEEPNIPFSVQYLLGESSLTLTIQCPGLSEAHIFLTYT